LDETDASVYSSSYLGEFGYVDASNRSTAQTSGVFSVERQVKAIVDTTYQSATQLTIDGDEVVALEDEPDTQPFRQEVETRLQTIDRLFQVRFDCLGGRI